ncbi:type II toxin-antitoxin system RelE/ParE family toxin [Candidatus Micrarchaeota archaeon]|nr:type II toxin-antitoxin system RelE/ParE family toxin [Candidatus Micrarchaeota archaeon]
MYSIGFVESARKEFRQLSDDDQRRVIAVLERIRVRPHSFTLRLSGSRAYRLRVGRLRVIADIIEEKQEIIVLKIGNRESVYLP